MKSIIAAAALAVSFVVPASAQSNCLPTEAMFEGLAKGFGELPVMRGIVRSNGFLMTVFANRETGTWTLIVTRPDGVSCMAADGGDFDAAAGFDAPPEGDPA